MGNNLPTLKPGRKNRFEAEGKQLNQAIKSVGIEVLASHLGKSPATVRSEMVLSRSPDSPHKIGFDDALSAMSLSGDVSALIRFLDRLDYVVVPRDRAQGHGSLEYQSLDLMSAAGQLSAFLAEALKDGEICKDEYDAGLDLAKKLESKLAAYNRI